MSSKENYRPPELNPPGVDILDSPDPIDGLVLDYQQAVITDKLPTGSEQQRLVAGVQRKDRDSARDLAKIHRGLVAAVAYNYKDQGIESNDLLTTGTKALLITACLYREDGDSDFSDHAIVAIDSALAAKVPGGQRMFEGTKENDPKPTEAIFQNMATLHEIIERERESRKVLEGFSPLEQKVLRLLHLPSQQQIVNAIGDSTNYAAVKNAKRRCFAKTGTDNVTGLVLEMHSRGLHYDVPEPEHPLVEILTDEELEIGNLLDIKYEDIGRIVNNLSAITVEKKVSGMQQKTGTQSRHELALVINMFDTGERQNSDTILSRKLNALSERLGVESLQKDEIEALLQQLPATQQVAFSHYWLTGEESSWKKVGDSLGVDPAVARNRTNRGIRAMRRRLASR